MACSIPPNDLVALKTQHQFASSWSELVPNFPSSAISILSSIEHAVSVIRNLAHASDETSVQVLVTGSLHLVGGVIEVAGLSDVAL
jgi:folylpolyglutamate synthase